MQSDFDAHKAMHHAHGHHAPAHKDGEGHHAPRWTPIAAAVLAVLAAIASLLSNQFTTQSLLEKNEAILLQAKASDTWNYYQAKRIKEHVYTAVALTLPASGLKELRSTARKEHGDQTKISDEAKALEHEVELRNARSERFMKAHETIEIAVTMFEVAIVLVSISALASSRLLTVLAGAGGVLGLIFLLLGLART